VGKGVLAGAGKFFEGCLPIEIMALRGRDALAFGPMRPVGLSDPHTDRRPYAVVQLRQDNLAATLYNLVGFQTNLKESEQRRVFRMIPGLEHAQFERYGQMHRNTFIFSPAHLKPTLEYVGREDLFFAGRSQAWKATSAHRNRLISRDKRGSGDSGGSSPGLARTTMLGALCHYITHASPDDFQPMKANFGIVPELEGELKICAANDRGQKRLLSVPNRSDSIPYKIQSKSTTSHNQLITI